MRTKQKACLFWVFLFLYIPEEKSYMRDTVRCPWTSLSLIDLPDTDKTKNRLYSQLRYITTQDMENKSNRQMKYSQCPESSGAGFQVFFSTRRHRPYFLASSDLQGHVRVVLCREVPWNQQRKEGWRGRYISTLRTTGMSRPHCPDAPLFLVNKTPSTRSIPRTGIGWGFLGGLMC